MSAIRFLTAAFLTLSLTSAVAFADTTSQNATPATGAPDNSTTITAPANANANPAANVVSNNAPSTAKKLQTVNINTADAKDISSSLRGIGPKRAAAIVAYRTQNGPFKAIEDLEKIKGISAKVVNENRARITLS